MAQGIEQMVDEEFRTAATCHVFKMLQPETESDTRLAALVLSNWNQIVTLLKNRFRAIAFSDTRQCKSSSAQPSRRGKVPS